MAVLTATLLSMAMPAVAAPHLRPGLWQFDRTSENNGQQTDRRLVDHLLFSPRDRRCVDPNAAIHAEFNATVLGFCRLSNVKQSDGEFVLSRSCGGGRPITTTIKSTDETSFEQTVEGSIGSVHTKETIVAQRVGDCSRPRTRPSRPRR